MREYRIKELNGEFTIQVKRVVSITTYKWFKPYVTTEEVWLNASHIGTEPIALPRTTCLTFPSLEAAMEQIRKWNNEPIYHYVKEL